MVSINSALPAVNPNLIVALIPKFEHKPDVGYRRLVWARTWLAAIQTLSNLTPQHAESDSCILS